MYRKCIVILVILSLFLVCIGSASANDANNTTISDFNELSGEINSTDVNCTLDLEKDYRTSPDSQQIIISKPVTIDGKNHVIEAPDVKRVFLVEADNVCIKNLNFVNCNSTGLAGGVISWLGNNGTLINCNFTNNNASSAGGAVLWNGNNGIIENCGFKNNSVTYGPAASLTDGESFDPSQIHIMVVNSEGGALYLTGDDILVDQCFFENNMALLNGGAISVNWANNVTVSNSKFRNNSAKYNGGAIDFNGDNFYLINSSFSDNSPNDLFNNCQNTTIISSNFKNSSLIDTWYNITMSDVTYGDVGSFEELALIINSTPEGAILTLDKDYKYVNGTNKGILISKSIVIDGNGHTLNGNKLSRMFNITADKVVIRNINFVNGNAFGHYFARYVGGGAIYWSGDNGLIENCNFTDNAGRGIEDDPFDKEEITVNEDGTVTHTIRIRPMGAKINEGGAIVWNGTNGVVSKCKFVNNSVGYPNTGGAICWRGDNGKVLDSQFYENNAWCGSAIAWIGDNGTILSSIIANSSFFDGGIYWFGSNGNIHNSILLGVSHSSALRPSDCDVNADYNFWGDTLENPNSTVKKGNLSNWLVMKFSHNGEFVKEGEKLIIRYDITSLMDSKGKLSQYFGLVNYSSQFVFKANKAGFLNITFKNGKVNVNIDSKTAVISKDLTCHYSGKISYKVSVYDVLGKVINKKVKFTVNKKNYYAYTNKNGVATLKLKLKPGKYTVYSSYEKVKVKNTIKIKTTLITKNVNKKVKKSGKFTVKVLNSKGKPISKKLVKIKFYGKTYKIKTNKKGIATLKLSKKLKVGKYTIKTTYNGLTNSNKIIVKK